MDHEVALAQHVHSEAVADVPVLLGHEQVQHLGGQQSQRFPVDQLQLAPLRAIHHLKTGREILFVTVGYGRRSKTNVISVLEEKASIHHYLDHVAEFTEQSGQRAGVVVLQSQPVPKGLAVFCEQLADGKAGVLLSTEQLDQLSCQGLDVLHFCQGQHLLLTTLQHLNKTAVPSMYASYIH